MEDSARLSVHTTSYAIRKTCTILGRFTDAGSRTLMSDCQVFSLIAHKICQVVRH
jgi:hypothetical protein